MPLGTLKTIEVIYKIKEASGKDLLLCNKVEI